MGEGIKKVTIFGKDGECFGVSPRAQHLQTRPLGALIESQHEKITAAQPGLKCSRVPRNTVILSFILVSVPIYHNKGLVSWDWPERPCFLCVLLSESF